MTTRRRARFLLVLTIGLLALAPHARQPAPVAAATLTFTVDSTADAPDAHPGDGICADAAGQCTLRAAIQEADAQPGSSRITIKVPAGTYGLTLGTLHLTANTITISGALSSTTIIKGNNTSTIMSITSTVQTRLSQLTITGGNAGKGSGGGITNEGLTVLRQSAVISNTAAKGSGIFNWGTGRLSLDGSLLSGNSASGYGIPFGGGGIYNSATLTVTSSTLSNNSAFEGGGIWNNGTLGVTGSTLSGNSGPFDGGGIWNTGTVIVSTSTLSNNVSSCGFGGGVANRGTLSVISSTVNNNSACQGSGIWNNRGTLSMTGSTVSNNSGHGIYNNSGTVSVNSSTLSNNPYSGIVNDNSVYGRGKLSVTDSTLSNNSDAIDNFGTATVTSLFYS